MRELPRDRLVGTALRLFSERGFHATGIDTILAEAGIAKMTLYKHFASKDELILATLKRKCDELHPWMAQRVEALARGGRDRLLAIFDALREGCADPKFYGCIFANAAAEFHDVDDPIHAEAYRQKRWTEDFIHGLAVKAGARSPHALALQLCVLIDGAIVLTHLSGDTEPIRQAAAAARILIDDSLPKRGPKPGARAARPVRKRGAKSGRQR